MWDMFNRYPYINLTDRNLDLLTKAIREMENEVKNFVSINAVKYANPIQWSINRQYEKNTIVIDPLTGTAFISVQPVPSGVSLTRTEYWTVVFDLSQFVTKAASNFANSYERDITTTATMATGAGDWVVWDSTLYVALTSIHAGDAYVVNGNIKRMTVEDFYHLLMEAIRALDGRIDGEIRDRQDADTALGGRIDDEIRDRQDAHNAILTIIGTLDELHTPDKTSIVNAMNSEITRVNNMLDVVNYDILDIRRYGGVGDGVTDNTAAFNACLTANGGVYIPSDGVYYFNSTLRLSDNEFVMGTSTKTHIKYNHSLTSVFDISGKNVVIKNLWFEGDATDTNTTILIRFRTDLDNVIENVVIDNIWALFAYMVASDMGNSYDDMSYHPMFIYISNVTNRFSRFGGFKFSTIEGFLFMRNCAVLCQGANQGNNAICFDFTRLSGGIFESCEVLGDLGNNVAKTPFQFNNCAAIWMSRTMVDYNYGTQGIRLVNCDAVYIEWSVVSVSASIGIIALNSTHIQIVNCYFNGRFNYLIQPSDVPALLFENAYVNISGCMFNGYKTAINAINNGTAAHINVNACQSTNGQYFYTDETPNLVFINGCMCDNVSINVSASSALPKYTIYNMDTGAIVTNIT